MMKSLNNYVAKLEAKVVEHELEYEKYKPPPSGSISPDPRLGASGLFEGGSLQGVLLLRSSSDTWGPGAWDLIHDKGLVGSF